MLGNAGKVNIPKMAKMYFQFHIKKAVRKPNFKSIRKIKLESQ